MFNVCVCVWSTTDYTNGRNMFGLNETTFLLPRLPLRSTIALVASHPSNFPTVIPLVLIDMLHSAFEGVGVDETIFCSYRWVAAGQEASQSRA